MADPRSELQQVQNANVTIAIAAAPDEWVVRSLVQVQNSGSKAMVLPGEVTVWARGPRDSKDTDPTHYSAAVDVTGLSAGRHTPG